MFAQLAVLFFALGIIALLLGARRIACLTMGVARVLFIVALVISAALLIVHFVR